MPWMPHWKTTLAMVAAYVILAWGAILLIKDSLLLYTILLLTFFFILLAGNMFIRRR